MTKYYDKEENTSGEKETEKISEEDVGKNEIGLGNETPTPPVEENDNKPAVKETPEEAPAEKETTKDVLDQKPTTESPVPEAESVPELEKQDDPAPKKGEEHEVFCNRYMNHPNILRKISPAYRRAAAEAVWKEHHTK